MEDSAAVKAKKKKTKTIWDKLLGSGFTTSVAALLLSLFALAALAAVFGANPIEVIARLFEGALSGRRQLIFTLTQTTPLILAALAVYIPYQAGFFNIGGQGQIQISALAAVLVTLHVNAAPDIVVPLAMLAGMAAAMIGVLLPLFLKIKRGANEVTLTIMMTFALTHLVYALVITVFKDPTAFFGTTRPVPAEFRLPTFFDMHVGIYIAVIVAVVTYWFLKNTVGGVYLKAAGLNPSASKISGIKVNRMIFVSVLAGVACAGLAGSIQVLGVSFRVAEEWALGWGFAGISVAFLGRNPIGIIPVAFILATIETGARFMQATTGVPAALSNVMQGLPVVIFIALAAWQQLRASRKTSVSGGDE